MGLRRPGDPSVDFLTPHERFQFEDSAALQYSLSSSVVYVIGCDVAKRFVIATGVVVADEPPDLLSQIVGIFPDKEVDLLFASPMIAFDLAVGLRMVWRCEDMTQPFCFQVFPEWLGYERRASI